MRRRAVRVIGASIAHFELDGEELEILVDDFGLRADERLAGFLEVGFLDGQAAGEPDAVLFGAEFGADVEPGFALEGLAPLGEHVEVPDPVLAPLDLEDVPRGGVDPRSAVKVPGGRRPGLGFGVDDDHGGRVDPVTAGDRKIVAGLEALAEQSDRREKSGAEDDDRRLAVSYTHLTL